MPDVMEEARRVLLEGIAGRIFPAAVADVGSSDGPLWHAAFGTLTFDRDSPPANETTPFDLASLTKVIATTTVVMELVATGAARLDEPIAASFSEWRGADRDTVTLADLLEHASGLPARLLEVPPASRREFEHDICAMPLEYRPRTRSIYSDLGFILLGMLAEKRGGRSLAEQFDTLASRLQVPLSFGWSGAAKTLAAPTSPLDDDLRRGRQLAGDVHDSYAAALGGIAGHAGLFGTAAGVAAFARLVLRAARGNVVPEPLSPASVARFTRESAVPGSSRALGWDTMRPTSSCGIRMSPAAIGHVGFTGTSLWIDPPRDRYFVLLANRACNGGTLEQMRAVRRAFHDALHEL